MTDSPHAAPDDWRAEDYQRFRPDYPAQLFDWLRQQVPGHHRALDVGCGTGQASRPLALRFDTVIACDLLPAQLAALQAPANCLPVAASSDALPFAEGSMDLITVAQALHWFDVPAFHRQAHRLLRHQGVLAVWTYGLCDIDGPCGALVRYFHDQTLASWWAPNRRHVVNGYRDLPFPWPRLAAPELWLRRDWSWQQMAGYLATWSAVSAARRAGPDPLAGLVDSLAHAWGDGLREVRWPLHVLAGRKTG